VARLGFSGEFLEAFARLQPSVRKATRQAFVKFAEHTHAGLNLEKIKNSRDPRIRTIRIDQYWRGVVLAPEHGDTYCILTVLGHDDAIAYARGHVFSVNPVLGVVEVRDDEALDMISPALHNQAATTDARLFGQVSDKDLTRLGVSADLLPLVRDLTSEAALRSLERMLPSSQCDILLALAAGMTVEETWEQVCAAQANVLAGATDADDLAAAMDRTFSRIVVADGENEIADLLDRPFEAWRVFLHPSQHRIAHAASFGGPAMVTGPAGTGKTVVALHRAAHLARRLPEGDDAPVLLTTFSRALAGNLAAALSRLEDDPGVRDRIDVLGIDRLAYRIFGEQAAARGERWSVATEADVSAAWRHAEAVTHASYSRDFLTTEWEQVILAQDIDNLGDYLACQRGGRGAALGSGQRVVVWNTVQEAVSCLRRHGRWTFPQIAAEVARHEAAHGQPRYRHAIIDEAQDLHPAHWRLLRAIVPAGRDDLFLVGDPNQRIYPNHASLRALGIETRGRSRRLTMGYRSTSEILDYATRILDGASITDLADEQRPDSLAGYRSLLHGRRPVVRSAPHRDAELAALVATVRDWLGSGVAQDGIVVAARTRALVRAVADALRQDGLVVTGLDRDENPGPGVRVTTMHKLKGLEFQCVALFGVDQETVPPAMMVSGGLDDDALEAALRRERCLLFVAATRGRDALYISYTGAPSSFLPAG
jgi:hypothetical protein